MACTRRAFARQTSPIAYHALRLRVRAAEEFELISSTKLGGQRRWRVFRWFSACPAPGKAASVQKVDIAGPAKSAGITISANNLQSMTTGRTFVTYIYLCFLQYSWF
ncbi:hypothetical protein BJ912DRAFT_925058 [Pholiota molesta]|nr:hypothetical protein BJ912DRAFT_925058 [Pholiota molesta]